MKKKPDPNRPRRWQSILKRLPTDRILLGVEVGVWMGRTAKELLAARPMLIHYMVDSWEAPNPDSAYAKTPDTIAKQPQSYFDECLKKTLAAVKPYGDRAVIMREWSHVAVKYFTPRTADFVFLDASHSYEDTLAEIKRWLPIVRPGGMLCGHDFRNLPRYPGVEKAWVEVFGLDNLEIDGDCTVFYRVPEDE